MTGWLKSSVVLLVVALLAWRVESQANAKKWWQTASFYQIYPRSFRDSDGNGIGDLKGISEKLAYLKEIGVAATWLSPIFTSPMADFGYDIANFTEIDPMFGTMEDFEELIAKANEIGVKIILDFVPNHSSDECEWFQKSIERDPEYADYYVWHPGKVVDGVRQPPTNWISVFRGSMWTWNEQRQEYYLHQFHAKQPDFNYRNPKVKEMMKDVLRFWLRKGVSGFRIDALPHVFEVAADENGDWPDEPINENVSDPEDYAYLDHIYTANQPETIELVYEFRAVIEEMNKELGGDDRIIMTEAYAPLDIQMQYYGNETVDGAHIPFNFQLISNLHANSRAAEYASLINSWLDAMPEGKTANWVMGNHDQSRIATRMGSDKVDIINILLLTLPGCSVTYNGEEIGMSDVWISWDDTMDPQGCQSNPEEYERLSRDPCRTPFQWSDSHAAGFTEGNETWLPVSDTFAKVNVKRERGITFSHLNVFKNLQNLRKLDTFMDGDAEVKAVNSNVLGVKRSLSGSPTYITLLNINNAVETINLSAAFAGLAAKCQYALVTDKSRAFTGDTVTTSSILLMPHEAVVLKCNQ